MKPAVVSTRNCVTIPLGKNLRKRHPYVVRVVPNDVTGPLALHDRRGTCAKLCHLNAGVLEQIQLLLGHISFLATDRYLACKAESGDLCKAKGDRYRSLNLTDRARTIRREHEYRFAMWPIRRRLPGGVARAAVKRRDFIKRLNIFAEKAEAGFEAVEHDLKLG